MKHKITERFVDFITARTLNEKGFECESYWYYPKNGGEVEMLEWDELQYYKEDFICAPTLEMVREWLEIEHNLFIEIRTGIDLDENYKETNVVWYDFDIIPVGLTYPDFPEDFEIITYDHSWEALEAAIKYCLKLI